MSFTLAVRTIYLSSSRESPAEVDAVFAEVRLKRSKFDPTQLELSLIDNTSQVGIAYRTREFDTQDEVFQFHEAWSRTEGEARAVMEIVEWWMQNRET